MKFPKKNIIDTWLNENGNPEIAKFVEKNLALIDKINSILNEQGIQKSQFAEMLGKRPSEITKWLSGTHNLTLKSISKMETVLGVELMSIATSNTVAKESTKEIEYVYLGSIQGGALKSAISDYEDSNYDIAM